MLPCDTKARHLGALNSLMMRAMLEHGHFPTKIDRNFTLRILMREVAVGWASTLYDISTPAGACPMVGLAGCTQLS
jgi:hypothetical protein